MTPSWSDQRTASSSARSDLVLRKMLVGKINPRFLAFRILKIDPLFIACHNPMQERLSFLSGKQNLACVLASLHLPIVQFMRHSFSDLPHVAAWKWLLEKHPIARQAFLAIGYRPRPKELTTDSPQSSCRFSRFLWFRSKLSSLNRWNQSLHVVSDKALCYRHPQAFDAIRQPISSNWNRKAKLPVYVFFLAKN